MRTANFSIVVPTENNFTKQSALSTGSWMESRLNLIEHTYFKKKKFLKIEKNQFYKSYEHYESASLTGTSALC